VPKGGWAVVVVLPLYDKDPLERKTTVPFVTYGLIVLNFSVFLYELMLPPDADNDLVRSFGFIPAALTSGHLDGVLSALITLATYTFLHGSWVHVGGNMLFLWVFGDNVEDAMGHARFALFYLLTGIAGAIAYGLSTPGSTAPLIGASGAISGIVAAYLMLRPCAKIEVFLLLFPVAITAYFALGGWIVLQLVNVVEHADGRVAWWAHLGGLSAGALLTPVLRRADVRLFDCMRPA
jgi:membrane associated rhomboid family serine protease